MQEVDFASLTAREAAPDPASPECGADMELYMQDCRQLLALGLKRWGGDAPGRLGPRVLNPDEPRDRAMIEGMFAPHPEADGTVAGPPPLQQAPAQAALPPAPQLPELQGSTAGDVRVAAAGEAPGAPQPMEVEAPPAPAPRSAPPLLVPRSALPSLDLPQLVAGLERVLAAAPLDEAVVGRLLDRLEGLGLSGQEMQNSGVPPAAAHVPSAPAHLHHQPACPNAMPLAALPPTSPSRGPAQARASWSTGCARSQERLRRSQRALASSTRSGRRTGVPTEPQLYAVCAV